jgi:hypothetical protein
MILIITSCAPAKFLPTDVSNNAKTLETPGNKSLIYVYRTSSLGAAVGLSVDCNNKELAKFFPRQFYLCVLDPGKYVFTGRGENEDDLIITIEVTPQMGWVKARCKLTSVDPAEGNTKIQKCKLVGLNLEAKALLNYKE